MKVSKPRTTRSAFTTQEATLGGETDKPATAEGNEPSKKSNENSKKKSNRKRKQSSNNNSAQNTSANVAASATTTSSSGPGGPPDSLNQNPAQKRNKTDKCTACGGTGHKFSRCYLVRETSDKEWVDWEVFDNNMKVASFRKRVEEVRSAAKVFKKANKE